MATVTATLLRVSIARLHVYDVSFLLPFIAIAASSMFGGGRAGLIATGVLAVAQAWLIKGADDAAGGGPGVKLLLEAGVLLSFVGGQVYAARNRARASHAATIDLERRVLEIGDEERSRIGHDLHDGLGQHLTGISLLSESLKNRIKESAGPAADAEKITQLTSEAIAWTRDLARSLSPTTLENDGLLAGLQELAENAGSLLHIQCHWDYKGAEPNLGRTQSLHVYRIAQEAVSNSVKHGKAKSVQISLENTGTTLILNVTDDGCGLSSKTIANPGMGLRIMTYRAKMVGAKLSVERASAQGGTVVTCVCPLNVGN
jgi:signal transduction histidine kinase